MDEEGHMWVGDEIEGLLGRRIGGHYDRGQLRVWRRGEVGVVHEGDMWMEVGAGC